MIGILLDLIIISKEAIMVMPLNLNIKRNFSPSLLLRSREIPIYSDWN